MEGNTCEDATAWRTDGRGSQLLEYLLSEDHPDGAPKAVFFRRMGFTRDAWHVLAEALREHGRMQQVVSVVEGSRGTRYVVEGPLHCPDGRSPRLRSVWMVEEHRPPRLITAYPARRR